MKKKKWPKEYISHLYNSRIVLEERHYQDSANFDKLLTTLASGGLGLTLAFFEAVVPEPDPNSYRLLFGSWGAFGLALVTILISYLFSMRAREKILAQIDDAFTTSNRDRWYRSKTIDYLNISSVFFLIGGIILFFLFVEANLIH